MCKFANKFYPFGLYLVDIGQMRDRQTVLNMWELQQSEAWLKYPNIQLCI